MDSIANELGRIWYATTLHLWHSTLFLVLIGALARALRDRAPASVVCGLYYVGVARLMLPIPVIQPLLDPVLRGLSDPGDRTAALTAFLNPPVFDRMSVTPSAPSFWALVLTAVWGAGLVAASWRLFRLRARERGVLDSPAVPLAEVSKLRAVSATLGIPARSVTCRDAELGPFVLGWHRPVIVFPLRLPRELSIAELRGVLLHEREHLRRKDPLAYAMLAVLGGLLWFFPPMTWLVRRIHELTELACDEAVTRGGIAAETFCATLARVISLNLTGPVARSPLGVYGHRVSFLNRRLERIRSQRRFKVMITHRALLAATVVLLALSLVVSAGSTPEPVAPDFDGPTFIPGKDGVTTPELVKASVVQPEYPIEARQRRLGGKVVLEAVIDSTGSVQRVAALRSEPDGYVPFIESAKAAVRQWKYVPALQNGKPVAVYLTVVVEFSLRSNLSDESPDV